MDPVYDARGEVCAWRLRQWLFGFHGAFVGFVYHGNVVDIHGRHVGWYENGNLLDRRGDVVGWLSGTVGGPSKPRVSTKSLLPPVTPAVTGPSVGPLAPRPPRSATAWSALTWQQYLGGDGLG
jgi:hypothetical protein